MLRGWLIASLLLLSAHNEVYAHHRVGHQYDRWQEHRGFKDCKDLDIAISILEKIVKDPNDSLIKQPQRQLENNRRWRSIFCLDA